MKCYIVQTSRGIDSIYIDKDHAIIYVKSNLLPDLNGDPWDYISEEYIEVPVDMELIYRSNGADPG